MKMALARVKTFAAHMLGRLRHPTRRGVALALAAVPTLVLLYVLVLIPFTPSISDLRKAKSEKPAQLLTADGKELALLKRANRDWATLDEISPAVVSALIATEDHRFFQHHGIDLRRTASAALHTFSGDLQGGSTITQQLARNLYPEEIGRAQTLTRKIKEAITALKIEVVYSKQEILETYLNTVPFLYNAYGIEMAARTYFDKSASELDELESATLIGMLKGTSYYNPVLNPERALQRRNTVLAQMVKRDKLSTARFETLKKRPLKVDFERQSEPLGSAPHVTQYLRRWLIEWADRKGYNIYADGLVVHTTLDSRLQKLANQAVARQADRLQGVANVEWGPRAWAAKKELVRAFVRETREYKNARNAGQSDAQALKALQADADFMRTLRQDKTRLQAGFLALDPRNGHVMAWVGSRDFDLDPFDHVQQARRQPGSTFKPFVYGAAFEQGAHPDDSFMDEAVAIPLGHGAVWRPTDGGEPSGRSMSLREGLVYSKNTITAQVMQSVGPARVAKLAQAMGVRQSKLEAVPALALGTSPVTLKEMVSAYGTIANSGAYIEPMLVTRIEDRNGRVLETFQSQAPEQAMSVAGAQTLLDVMRGVIDRGTGAGIRNRFGIRADVAGKTGTTQDNTDGWFILMHAQLVAGAWVGFNDNRVTIQSNYWGQGAHSALPMVGDFFAQSLNARVIDPNARLAAAPDVTALDSLPTQLGNWLSGLFSSTPEAVAKPEAEPVTRPAAVTVAPVSPISPISPAVSVPELPPAPTAPAQFPALAQPQIPPAPPDDALDVWIRSTPAGEGGAAEKPADSFPRPIGLQDAVTPGG
ncbi:penicillin-binding protein 1A [Polaromonas sp. OV174]|uniref:penicillin-binding protein 1A n=1 Tax=Polaromonas sp. OV174 TaxID=1855300 RepID=UPI0008EA3795|nr:transglycosylase domain-containing protein [Polaromonas sp. OV174]SFB94637.1 penicillin-binding protein 1A [Polaromonas sp. OV174]